MLILLPASETKRNVDQGAPLDPATLSFPALAPTRRQVLEAVIDASGRPDATRLLGMKSSMDALVRSNLDLRRAPAAAAEQVYAGALYDGLDLESLDVASRRRARNWIVVVSALFGAVRLGDRIPAYRLRMCARLPGLGHLPQVWKSPLDATLGDAARKGLVVDGRSGEFLTAWRPTGAIADRTVHLRPVQADGRRGAPSHPARHVRGEVVRRIVVDAIDPPTPDELAAALSGHFDVDLHQPSRAGQPWELRVIAVA